MDTSSRRRAAPAARIARRLLLPIGGVALAVCLLIVGLPRATAVSWNAVVAPLASLTPVRVALLVMVWLAGLLVHTIVLTAAQPHLTHRRALTLNLTGSAVAGLVPLGGAAGVGLNYLMTRIWGISPQSFAAYTLVTNLCDVAAKVGFATLGLLLVLAGGPIAGSVMVAAAAVLGAVVSLSLLVLGLLLHPGATRRLGGLADRLLLRLPGVRAQRGFEEALLSFRTVVLGRLRSAWPALSFGMVGYCLLQLVLLWLSFRVLGADLALVPLLAAYALERVLTLALVTPGGTGFAEIGMTSLLIALHGDPVMSTAGVLLYRTFMVGAEIPVGAVVLAGWSWANRHALLARRLAVGGAT